MRVEQLRHRYSAVGSCLYIGQWNGERMWKKAVVIWTLPAFTQRDWRKPHKTLIRIACVETDIGNAHLWNVGSARAGSSYEMISHSHFISEGHNGSQLCRQINMAWCGIKHGGLRLSLLLLSSTFLSSTLFTDHLVGQIWAMENYV
jgi:hypothetical protein